MKPTYESPLASRYASKTMLHLFSPDMRYETWRRLWVALARAEHTLGLPVTQQQVDELAAHVSPIDYDAVAKREKEVRHDVMAHIYAYGLDAPGAKGIIHLGATSCYVTDNADLIIYREALRYLEKELKAAMRNLCDFADRYAAMPALAYTHYQPAQLTTIGKRASLWLQDLLLDLEELQDTLRAFRFLGCRGTTGTEASFVELFDGDTAKIDEMNRQIAAEFGFDRCYPVCGQTYPRKLDSRILNVLSSICQSAYRMATDILVTAENLSSFHGRSDCTFVVANKGQTDERKDSLKTFIDKLPSRDEGKNLTHTEKFDNAFIEYDNISIKVRAIKFVYDVHFSYDQQHIDAMNLAKAVVNNVITGRSFLINIRNDVSELK